MKQETVIVARGELSTLERDVVIRYLGRQGLIANIVVPEQGELDFPIPLGMADKDEFEAFQKTDERYADSTRNIAVRTFNSMYRASYWADERDDISWASDFKGIASNQQINLDQAEELIRKNKLIELPNFGVRSNQFITDFIEHRRQGLALAILEA